MWSSEYKIISFAFHFKLFLKKINCNFVIFDGSVFSTPKNLSADGKVSHKRKLSDRTMKTYIMFILRNTIEFNFATDSEKLQFDQKVRSCNFKQVTHKK